MVNLYNGDCLELMKDIPSYSIDLILADPPRTEQQTADGTQLFRLNRCGSK